MPIQREMKTLLQEEIETLKELYKDDFKGWRTRYRAHIILLINKGRSINDISEIYDLDRDTVSATIKNWEEKGVVGLFEGKRPGRPSIYDHEEEEKIINFIKSEPRQIKFAKEKIESETGKNSSIKTLKRIAKRFKMKWKRARKTTKGKPDKKKYDLKKAEIAEYVEKEKKGDIDLYFFDGSGFSLSSYTPYAWQEIAKTIEIATSRSGSLNVLGFLSKLGTFYSYVAECNVDTDIVISVFQEFAKNIKKETHVYIDNAPIHTSKKFLSEIEVLKEKNIYVHFLTPYSPQLNIIEILWRFIKYSWLDLSSFLSFKNLKDNLFNVLRKIEDGRCQINFV